MPDIILKDAHILTMNSPTEFPKLRTVYVHNNKIMKIVKSFDGKVPNGVQLLDCRGQLLMPSFKNGHSHVAMHFLREIATQDNFEDWLSNVLAYEKHLTQEDVYYLSLYGLLELARSGYSYTFDMYYHSPAYASACIRLGFRSDVLLTTSNTDPQLRDISTEYFVLDKFDPLIAPKYGIHALYSTDLSIIKKLSSVLSRKRLPFYTHLAETKNEVVDSIEKYEKTPLSTLFKLGVFNNGGAIFHGSHLDAEDIKLLIKKRISVITCPQSNVQLNTGLPDYKKLLDAKINIGIGTDGSASNKFLDPFNEMRIIRHELLKSNSKIPNLEFNILKMSTQNVMNAVKKRNLSKISSSQLADLILVDTGGDIDFENPQYFERLIERGSKKDILMTMIDGKIVYMNNTFPLIGDDIPMIKREVEQRRKRILTVTEF